MAHRYKRFSPFRERRGTTAPHAASSRPMSPTSPTDTAVPTHEEELRTLNSRTLRRALASPSVGASVRSYGLRSPSPVASLAPMEAGFKEYTIFREHRNDRLGLGFEDDREELRVTDVWPGPCKTAGMEKGAVIVAVDAVSVASLDQMQRQLAVANLNFVLEVMLPVEASSARLLEESPRNRHRKPMTYENAIAASAHIIAAGEGVTQAPPSHRPLLARTPLSGVQDADECDQLRLQLEAANVQVKSAQSRTALAHERERELTEELLEAKQRVRQLEVDYSDEASKRQLVEQDIKALVHSTTASAIPLTAVSALQEEVDYLRKENLSLQQRKSFSTAPLPTAPMGLEEAKYKELLRQFETERREWERERHDLNTQLHTLQIRASEADALKQELEVLTLSLRTGANPPLASRHASPTRPGPLTPAQPTPTPRANNTLASYAGGQPGSKTVSPVSALSFTPRGGGGGGGGTTGRTTNTSLLLSKRLESEEDTLPKEKVEKDPPAAPISALDQRLDVLARRAKEAIRSAEVRNTPDDEPLTYRLKPDDRSATALRVRAALGDDKAEKEKEKEKESSRERQRAEEARLAKIRADATRRARQAKEDTSTRTERSKSPFVFTTKLEAGSVFSALLERSNVRGGIHIEDLPEILQCSPTWKVLFRGLSGDKDQIVSRTTWLDWVRKLEEKNGPQEATTRLSWVRDQLSQKEEKKEAKEKDKGSPFGGQTTRELMAEAKFSDRLKGKTDEPAQLTKYSEWGDHEQ